MRHSNKERDNVAESRPGSNTGCAFVTRSKLIAAFVLATAKQ